MEIPDAPYLHIDVQLAKTDVLAPTPIMWQFKPFFIASARSWAAMTKGSTTAFTCALEDVFMVDVKLCSGRWVEGKGEKTGKPTRYIYCGADRMYKLTGRPASIGAQMLARGETG